MNNSNQALERRHIKEAAQWLVRLSSGRVSEKEHQAWEQWHSQSEHQQRAWRLARSVTSRFDGVPQGLDTTAVIGEVMPSRRSALKALSIIAVATPAAWAVTQLSWHEWAAEYRTATGERQTVALVDGTKVVLNTASAIDVDFNSVRRLISLWAGEVMVMPAADTTTSNRPFVLRTAQGEIGASGQRFSAQIRSSSTTDVSALDGRLEIRPTDSRDRPFVLDAGRQASFARSAVLRESAVEPNADLWTEGLLFASEMRLSDLTAALSRYRRGLIRCDPAVADLRVSGVFQLRSIDQVLALLEKSYPISVRNVMFGWTVIEAR